MNPKLTLIKKSLVSEAVVGDIVTYTIIARNDGDIELNNVTVRDELASDVKFVSGSVKINLSSDPNQTIISGVNIGNLTIGQSKTVSFDTKIISKNNGNVILNTAIGDFNYNAEQGKPPRVGSAISNTNEIIIKKANLTVTKSANKEYVSLNDTITYTVAVKNDGEINAINVIFKDELSSVSKLVERTFTINGVLVNSVNLNSGVTIGDIPEGETVTLKYDVKVMTGNCCGKLINSAFTEYSYILSNGYTGTRISEKSKITIVIAISAFKQISLDEYLEIPTQKPDMEQLNEIKGTVNILNCHVIQTTKATSKEGQILSGYKLVVHGVLKQVVQYTAVDTQAIHSAHYDVPFSTFIVLPPDYLVGSKIEVEGVIEDIYYNMIDGRTFFKNATVLVLAKILSR